MGGHAGAESEATFVRSHESIRGAYADSVAGEGDRGGEHVAVLLVAWGDGDGGLGCLLR